MNERARETEGQREQTLILPTFQTLHTDVKEREGGKTRGRNPLRNEIPECRNILIALEIAHKKVRDGLAIFIYITV